MIQSVRSLFLRSPGSFASAAASPPRAWTGWLMVLPVAAALVLSAPAQAQRSAPESFAPLAERTLPAVVNISTTQTIKNAGRSPVPMPEFPPGSPFEEFFREFFERQQQDPNAPPRRAASLGSGFIIDPSGYVVTNNHVIEGADEVRVIFQDAENTELKAKIIGVDKDTDLALLKVETDKKLPSLSWGDSDSLRVGDWVVAIGNPFGLGGTVTAGIISARARDIGAGRYDDFLQTDASINRGNSGGPLVNLKGEVVGINTAIFSQTGGSVGIGFAIPATMAKNVINQIKEGGKVRRGWLGVQIQAVTPDIAESMKLQEAQGALVSQVTEDGPAAKAGIRPGDVILTFDGREVNSSRSLPRMVAETQVGKAVPVTIIRKGSRQTVSVNLGELPSENIQMANVPGPSSPSEAAPETIDSVGVAVTVISPEVRRQFELSEESRGVVVTQVDPNGPAAQRGLRAGDVIVEVSQEEVVTPEDVSNRVAKAREAGQKALLLLVERRGELIFVALPLGTQ